MQDLIFTLRVTCTALARLLRRHGQVLLLGLSPVLFLLAIGIPRTERYQRWAAQRRAADWEDTRKRVHAAAAARVAAMTPTPAQLAEARARALAREQRAAERAQTLDRKAVAAKVRELCGVEPTLIIPAGHVAGLEGTAQVDAVYLGGLNASLALFDQASVKCAVCAEAPADNNDPDTFDPGSWILVEERLPVEPKSAGNCQPRSVPDLFVDVGSLVGTEKLAHRRRSWAEMSARVEVARPGADPPSIDTTLIYADMAPPDSGAGTADRAPPTPDQGPRVGGQTGNGSGSYSPQGGGRPTLQYLGQPPRDPGCDNVRLMDKAGTTGQKLRVCAHDDPDPTCLHEAAPPGPVPTGAPTEPEPGAGEGGMRIRRQGRPRIPPHGQKPPAWPPGCPVRGAPGPDGRPIPSAVVPSPRPHARPHDSEETPQRANELEALAYAELLKDPFFKGDDPYDDISEDEERACKAARYPYMDARLPDVRHGLDEFKACRAVAAALLRSARSARALLRSMPTAYACVAHRLDSLPARALDAFREACRYHDAPSCVSYALLRSSGFPTSAPTPKDREAGRSALVRGCKLAQMQAGVILSACTGEARPVPGKEVCEPDVESLDEHRPHIGPCLDGSKAPPPPPPPSPR